MLLFENIEPLKKYKDSFQGTTPVVIGSGPTKFDYRKLDNINDPILFLNDAVWLGDREDRFFFTHHTEVERWLSVKSTYIFIEDRINSGGTKFAQTKPHGKYLPIKIEMDKRFPQVLGRILDQNLPDWALDKDKVLTRKTFCAHIGSISTLIHFLWFCGVKKILGIGINNTYTTLKHDPRIQKFYSKKEYPNYCPKGELMNFCPNLPEIIWNQTKYLDFFGIEMECYPIS